MLESRLDALTKVVVEENAPVGPAVTGGLGANLMRRLDRFERRLIAASKKVHADVMQEIGTARGSLYPLGKPQERALNFIPLLARYGPALRDDMLAGARAHTERLLGDARSSNTLVEAATARGRS
jgi:hypothetical protein